MPPPAPRRGAHADAEEARADAAAADTSGDPEPVAARPPDGPDPFATSPFVAEAQFGIGQPLGIVGVALDFSPVPMLALNLGIGWGWVGLQYEFMPRLRVFRWGSRRQFAAYLGAGVSAGAFDAPYQIPISIPAGEGETDQVENPYAHNHWSMAYWTNLEAGVDMRLGRHVSLRPFVGAEILLNPESHTGVTGQHGEAPPSNIQLWAPYVGVGIGYALGGP